MEELIKAKIEMLIWERNLYRTIIEMSCKGASNKEILDRIKLSTFVDN